MDYGSNWYFCRHPLIDPTTHYHCKHLITINLFPDNCPADQLGRAVQQGTDEWNNCVKRIRRQGRGDWDERISTLNDEVIEWLNENIKDSTDKQRKDMPQGWVIDDPATTTETISVSVFFLRKADAMAFKLRWS